MNEPTYSQIEAACQAMWGNDHPEFYNRDLMKAALIAAQGVDQNIYGHMHYGYSCDGVTLMTDSLPSRDRIAYWHHLAETTIPYHEKHTIPELKRLREQVEDLKTRLNEANNQLGAARRWATDEAYMVRAVVQMLGPLGRKVWKLWQDKGVKRIHTSWGPKAAEMSGEEIAQAHLDMEEAIKTSTPIEDFDGHLKNLRDGIDVA